MRCFCRLEDLRVGAQRRLAAEVGVRVYTVFAGRYIMDAFGRMREADQEIDTSELEGIAEQIKEWLTGMEGVYDISDSFEAGIGFDADAVEVGHDRPRVEAHGHDLLATLEPLDHLDLTIDHAADFYGQC